MFYIEHEFFKTNTVTFWEKIKAMIKSSNQENLEMHMF